MVTDQLPAFTGLLKEEDMQVITDDRGYVLSFAFVGNMVGASETPEPEDMDLFMHQFYAQVSALKQMVITLLCT